MLESRGRSTLWHIKYSVSETVAKNFRYYMQERPFLEWSALDRFPFVLHPFTPLSASSIRLLSQRSNISNNMITLMKGRWCVMAAIQWSGGKMHGATEAKASMMHDDKDMRMIHNHMNPDIDVSKTPNNFSYRGLLIHSQLAPGQAGVRSGAAQHEPPRGVYQQLGSRLPHIGASHGLIHHLCHQLAELLLRRVRRVLH